MSHRSLAGAVAAGALNHGNGTMSAPLPSANAPAETWTVTMTGAGAFNVSGSVSGAQAAGAIAPAYYSNGLVKFQISAGGTAFQAGDTFTFAVARTANANGRLIAQLRNPVTLADATSQPGPAFWAQPALGAAWRWWMGSGW